MAPTHRLRYDGLLCGEDKPTLSAGIDADDTTVTFPDALTYAGGQPVPDIADPDYLAFVVEADTDTQETIWVTAYTEGATTATVQRAKEGSTGVIHSSGVKLVHGPTVFDMPVDHQGHRWVALSPHPSALAADPGDPYFDEAWCVAIGTKIYLGGSCQADFCPSPETWEYNTLTDAWTQKADMAVPMENAASAVMGDGRIIVAGGDGDGTGVETQIYNPAANTWTQVADMPEIRTYASGVWHNNRFIVYGAGVSNDVLQYDPVLDDWTVHSTLLINIARPVVWSLSGVLYIGLGENQASPKKAVSLLYSWNGTAWVDSYAPPWGGGPIMAALASDGTSGYLIGGGIPTPGHLGGSGAYSTSAMVIRVQPGPETFSLHSNLPQPTSWGSAAVIGDTVYAFGGFNTAPYTFKSIPTSTTRLIDLADFSPPGNQNLPAQPSWVIWNGQSFEFSDVPIPEVDLYYSISTNTTITDGMIGNEVRADSASPITITIPPNSTHPWRLHSWVRLYREGAGTVTVAPGSGVTLRAPGGKTKLAAQYSRAVIRKIYENAWSIEGDIST